MKLEFVAQWPNKRSILTFLPNKLSVDRQRLESKSARLQEVIFKVLVSNYQPMLRHLFSEVSD